MCTNRVRLQKGKACLNDSVHRRIFPAALGQTSTDATLNDKNTRFAPQTQKILEGAGQNTHLSYNTNFPKKNPMKIAAITTSSEGSDLELVSFLTMAAVFETMFSERWTFLIRRPSS